MLICHPNSGPMKTKKVILLTLILNLLLVFYSNSQIEIEQGKHPFHSVVEWKNKGTLLMNSDLKEKTRDFEIVLLNDASEVQWRKTIYPNHSKPSLILSSASNYIYFIDQFDVVNSKMSYIQVNQSGSIISTRFDLLKIIRSYGYTIPSELVVEEVVNTPKSLVFHFTLEVKDKNIVENFFVAITHHNNRVYHYQGPNTHPDLIDDEREGLFTFSGADEENIYFSRLLKQGGGKRIHFYPISPKAKEGNEYSFSLPDKFAPLQSEINQKNLCGSYYQQKLNKKTVERKAIGIFNNGRFYVAANDEKGKCLKIYGADQDGNIKELNNCSNPAEKSRRYDSKITWLDNNGRTIISGDIEDKAAAVLIDGSTITNIPEDKLNLDLLQINPSSFNLENKTTNFVHVVDNKHYFFDLNTLGDQGNVVFKEE